MSTEHLSHGQRRTAGPFTRDVSFEKSDVHTSPIIKFLFYLGIAVVLSYLLTFGIYKGLKNYWASTYTPPMPSRVEMGPTLPPEPRLQGMPGHLVDPQAGHARKNEGG